MKEHKIQDLEISKIKLDNSNPNIMDKEMQNRLFKSMEEFGNTQPIIVDKNTLILADGEHRLKKYIKEGKQSIPSILVDFKNDAHRRLYRQAANKIHGLHDPKIDAEEYLKILDSEEKELLKMATGLSLTEVEKHLRRQELLNKEEDFDAEAELDKITQPVTKPGDIYQLGPHRLMCGDSTKEGDVKKLMNGKKSILMVTDPPYGVNYKPKWRESYRGKTKTENYDEVHNDNRVDWSVTYKLFNPQVIYNWHASWFTSKVQESLEKEGYEVISNIIWNKSNFTLGRGDYHWKHEPCWYAVKKGEKHNWQGSRKEVTVWEIPSNDMTNPQREETYGHSTQKPLNCMIIPIKNNSKEEELVVDPFGGTGTTLIASEKVGRVCYMMEIDPKYCDVIVKRYESFTNKKVEKIT